MNPAGVTLGGLRLLSCIMYQNSLKSLPHREQTGRGAEAGRPPPSWCPKDAPGWEQSPRINESSHTFLKGIWFLLTKQSRPCIKKKKIPLLSSYGNMDSHSTPILIISGIRAHDRRKSPLKNWRGPVKVGRQEPDSCRHEKCPL